MNIEQIVSVTLIALGVLGITIIFEELFYETFYKKRG